MNAEKRGGFVEKEDNFAPISGMSGAKKRRMATNRAHPTWDDNRIQEARYA